MPDVALPDPKAFQLARRTLRKLVRGALEALQLGAYFADLDLTIQIRNAKIVRIDWREIDVGSN